MVEGESVPVEPQRDGAAPPEAVPDALTDKQRRLERIRQHQFKPGQSGNPRGKPKGSLSITTRLTKALRKRDPEDPNGRRFVDQLITAMVRELVKDPVRAQRMLDRLMDVDEGPVEQAIAVRGGSLIELVRTVEASGQAPGAVEGGDPDPDADGPEQA